MKESLEISDQKLEVLREDKLADGELAVKCSSCYNFQSSKAA